MLSGQLCNYGFDVGVEPFVCLCVVANVLSFTHLHLHLDRELITLSPSTRLSHT